MKRYEAFERIIKNREIISLKHSIDEWGVDVRVFAPRVSKESRVYGNDSGEVDESKYHDITAILTSDDFFTSGGSVSGNFNEGWLYTNDDNINVGQIVQVLSVDRKTRRYKITEQESIGTTVEIFTRWKIASLGD